RINNIARHRLVGGAGNAHRLVVHQVNRLWLGAQAFAVHHHLIAGLHLHAVIRHLTVDRNAPLLNELIGLAARTDTGIADVFVQADAGGGFIRHGVLAVTVGLVVKGEDTGQSGRGQVRGGRFCHGQRPVSSRSSVKLRKVRIRTTNANTPIDSKVSSTATV